MGIFGSSDTFAGARAFRAAGTLSAEKMAAELRGAELYVLFEGEALALHPLAVSTPEGYDVICAFSTPERAIELQKTRPSCRAAVPVDAGWVLATLPPGCGIAIDVGSEDCRFLEPDSVAWLREEMRRSA
jgi:hypothetical protein